MKVPQNAFSESPCVSVSKRLFLQNLSFENEFDLHENEPAAGEAHFHKNGLARKTRLDTEAKGDSEMAY